MPNEETRWKLSTHNRPQGCSTHLMAQMLRPQARCRSLTTAQWATQSLSPHHLQDQRHGTAAITTTPWHASSAAQRLRVDRAASAPKRLRVDTPLLSSSSDDATSSSESESETLGILRLAPAWAQHRLLLEGCCSQQAEEQPGVLLASSHRGPA